MRANGKDLSLVIGEIEIRCVSTEVVLDVEKADPDRVTFDDVINGLDWVWFFQITALPDYAPGSFWSLLYDTPAYTPLGYVFAPYANEIPTLEQPHFTGFATVDQKPPLGGGAGQSWVFATRLTCTEPPTRVTSDEEVLTA